VQTALHFCVLWQGWWHFAFNNDRVGFGVGNNWVRLASGQCVVFLERKVCIMVRPGRLEVLFKVVYGWPFSWKMTRY